MLSKNKYAKKTFSEKEIRTLKEVCKLFSDPAVLKSKLLLKSLIKYKKPFSEKDIKIIKLICEEHTTKEIAEKIGLSFDRIKQIKGELFKKTNSKSSVGIVKYAIKNKIVVLK